jgi:hypothetical protein
LRDFGWLIALTMLTCAAGTLMFLPPLIRVLRPYFIYGKEPQYINMVLSLPQVRIPGTRLELGLDARPWLSSGLKRISHYF